MPRPRLVFALALALCLLLPLAIQTGHTEDDDGPQGQDAVLALIAPQPGEVVADLGCGRGAWTFPLARAVGEHGTVYAVDIDADALAIVKARMEKDAVSNVKLQQSVPDDPMLPKNTLDVVFLNDVIDYVKRDALVGFLEGIRVALKERGRLIIRDPNGGPGRVIAECYRAGFSLDEARIPLPDAPGRSFSSSWYALKLRRATHQHAILPRLGEPRRYRTRLHLAEELFRAGVIDRKEVSAIWDATNRLPRDFDPEVDEALDLIAAAEATGTVDKAKAEALRKRVRRKAKR
ncbi:MAG: methyltransferase domain-containing protein [Planctomycetota bacterium]|nr:methyltransferase domain-containing protein [Planctomycetota bacterium]